MRKWKDYKKTFKSEPDIFDFARSGDMRGLAELLAKYPDLDLNKKNFRGYSALMLAVYNGQVDFAEALLRGGANPNSTDNMGNTILMGASFKGNNDLIKKLLDFGANISLVNNSGMTALDWASMFGRKETVSFYRERFKNEIEPASKLKNIFRFIKLLFSKK